MTTGLTTRQRHPSRRYGLLTAALALGASCPWALTCAGTPAPADASREWHFRVLLDGKPIGEHDFTVRGEPGSEEVETRARFSVRALFIPVYGYLHQDNEVWRGGCLLHIEARTSDNGHDSHVVGNLTPAGFEVHGPQGIATLPSCISSFAYWDRAHLAAARLLNVQSGDYEPVLLSAQGTENILSQGRRVQAQRYGLAAAHFTVKLWYSQDGQWLALESPTAQGHTLRYEKL